MDAQLKRGMLDVCVLASVADRDSYGYQIVKDVGTCIEMTESTLYPILRRLEGSGALEAYSVEHQGRLRRYYRITEEGKKQIGEFLLSKDTVLKVYQYIEERNRT